MIYMHFYYASYFGIVKKSNASWSHLTKLRCRKKSMTNDVPTIIMSQLPSSTVWEHVFTSLIVRWILIAFDTKSQFSMISTNRISTILEKPDRGITYVAMLVAIINVADVEMHLKLFISLEKSFFVAWVCVCVCAGAAVTRLECFSVYRYGTNQSYQLV